MLINSKAVLNRVFATLIFAETEAAELEQDAAILANAPEADEFDTNSSDALEHRTPFYF